MPSLKNQKHELFCQNTVNSVKHGWSQADAYLKSGYSTTPHAAEVAASRLLKKAEIRARLAEITAPSIQKTRTTVDSLTAQFDQVFDAALKAEQLGAAGAAAGLKARLLGFMRDRVEVGGPGEFAHLQTADEVIDVLIREAGSPQAALAQLDQMRAMVERRAALHVTPQVSMPRPASTKRA